MGAFGINEGIQLASAIREFGAFDKKQKTDAEDRALKLQDDATARDAALKLQTEQDADAWTTEKVSSGIIEGGADYQPDEATKKDPRYRAASHAKAQQTALSAVLKNDEIKTLQAENDVKRTKASREKLTQGFQQAWGLYQADQNQGMSALLNLYDDVNDGLDIVKDESGAPIINQEAGTMRVKNRKGSTTDIPVPSADQIYKMAQSMLLEGGLEKNAPGWEQNRRAYNMGQMMKGTYYENAEGKMVVKYDSLVDPEDPKKTTTVIQDVDSGEELTPKKFGRGGYKEVSMKEDAASSGETANDQLTAAKKELDMALLPFGKGTEAVTKDVVSGGEWTKVVTKEAQSAFQVALQTVQKYQENPDAATTIQGKAELAAAQKAVSLWQQVVGSGATQQAETASSPQTPTTQAQAALSAAPQPAGQFSPQQQVAAGLPEGLDEQTLQYNNMQKYGKPLDKETAIQFYKQAGGDRTKAEQLARQAGYSF